MAGRQEGWFDGRKARSDGFMVGRQEGWGDGRKTGGVGCYEERAIVGQKCERVPAGRKEEWRMVGRRGERMTI